MTKEGVSGIRKGSVRGDNGVTRRGRETNRGPVIFLLISSIVTTLLPSGNGQAVSHVVDSASIAVGNRNALLVEASLKGTVTVGGVTGMASGDIFMLSEGPSPDKRMTRYVTRRPAIIITTKRI